MRRKMNGLSGAESLVPRQNAISRVSFAKSLCPTLKDRVVPAPRCVRLSGNRFEPCDTATFHFQIHFRVAVRRGQAGMLHTSSKALHCKAFLLEIRIRRLTSNRPRTAID